MLIDFSKLTFISLKSIFFLSLQFGDAHAESCFQWLKFSSTPATTSDRQKVEYQNAKILASHGDFEGAIAANKRIRKKISTMEIVAFDSSKRLGSHGAYLATLKDGTEVLIKPDSYDFYSSVPKEVGISLFSDLAGLFSVPVAGYRIDPKSGNFASVHLIENSGPGIDFSRFLMGIKRRLSRENREYFNVNTWNNAYGPKLTFLMNVIGYSDYEAMPRHILVENIDGQIFKSLIDLGSAFIEPTFDFVSVEDASLILIPEDLRMHILNLDKSVFQRLLSPYLPGMAIDGLFNRLLYSVEIVDASARAAKMPSDVRSSYIEHAHKAIGDKYHDHMLFFIPQRWNWSDVLNPAPKE